MNSIRNIWLSSVGVLKEPSIDVGVVASLIPYSAHWWYVVSLVYT